MTQFNDFLTIILAVGLGLALVYISAYSRATRDARLKLSDDGETASHASSNLLLIVIAFALLFFAVMWAFGLPSFSTESSKGERALQPDQFVPEYYEANPRVRHRQADAANKLRLVDSEVKIGVVRLDTTPTLAKGQQRNTQTDAAKSTYFHGIQLAAFTSEVNANAFAEAQGSKHPWVKVQRGTDNYFRVYSCFSTEAAARAYAKRKRLKPIIALLTDKTTP